MSAGAIGAAGAMAHKGQIAMTDHACDERERERQITQTCPQCHERIASDLLRYHVMIAHG